MAKPEFILIISSRLDFPSTVLDRPSEELFVANFRHFPLLTSCMNS